MAVVTDGSAVLGLGDIGPEAGMPVMEGKCVLFKAFGGVDAIPLCVRSHDVDEIVNTVALLAGSFGGVNLEDIAAPRCFEIEKKLKERCDIPIFHDDQHGTAVVTLAALLNALKLTGKSLENIRVVTSGAGAAGIAIIRLLLSMGLQDVVLCDRQGAIYQGREGLNAVKEEMALLTNREKRKGSLADVDDGIVMILGSGIAGGLIKDHRVHSGKGFNAGEFSYTVCRPGDYSMMSCATMAVGALGITYKLCKMKNLDLSVQDAAPTLLFLDTVLGKYFPAMDGEPEKTVADGKQFFAWVKEGDRDALRVYQDFITALGAMVFNAQICYAPDRIVIGGGLSMGETVLTDLKAELAKYDAGFGMNGLMSAEVVRSTYLGEANLYGAAYHYIGRCVNQ